MRNANHYVLRVRLETDRMLRGQSFVGRAMTGQLQPEAYARFVRHASDLFRATTAPQGLLKAGTRDLAALDERRDLGFGVSPLVPELESLVEGLGHPELWGATLSALLGTSWIETAIRGLRERLRGNTAFLEALADAGTLSVGAIACHPSTTEAITALELTRGVVFGVFSHLEATAPRLCGQGLHP